MNLDEFMDVQKQKFASGIIRVLLGFYASNKDHNKVIMHALKIGLDVKYRHNELGRLFQVKRFENRLYWLCINPGYVEKDGSWWVCLEI